MIIILGSIVGTPESFEESLAAGRQHTQRSRSEPGCLSHELSVDVENPHRLVFVERWADQAAIDAHFRVPEARQYAARARELAAEPPELHIHPVA
jgi:quinol monooxygenase YgiN